MNLLINNWYILMALCITVVFAIWGIYKNTKKPTDEMIEALCEELKIWVCKAESQLGSGTGQLKLRLVYDWATTKFPWVAKAISFECFDIYVKEALKWMEQQMLNNQRIKDLINNGFIS